MDRLVLAVLATAVLVIAVGEGFYRYDENGNVIE